jgi:hypothetical protein
MTSTHHGEQVHILLGVEPNWIGTAGTWSNSNSQEDLKLLMQMTSKTTCATVYRITCSWSYVVYRTV